MESILTDEEFYDLFKALQLCIELHPDVLENRKGLLDRLRNQYANSLDVTEDDDCEFVITVRTRSRQ